MKLSIAWIFDHIDADWHKQDIPELVNLFNQKTAEVEAFYPIKIELEHLFLGQVSSIAQETIELNVPEIKGTVELPKRDGMLVGQWYFLTCQGKEWRYAVGKDFYNDSLGELPAVYVDETMAAGQWKQYIDADDYILEVDNKSITHRPDLWCHRGFAREVAILLDLKLKPLDQIIVSLPIKQFAHESKADGEQPYAVRIRQSDLVKRFAIAYFNTIENRLSLPWMAIRLCRVESKPIDAIVDMTNYVLFDVGQPLHAFDAEKIKTNAIEPRLAKATETLVLLDDETIELSDKDIVITDGNRPIALAGIMGGKETAVSMDTHAILLEAAHFDATTIRISAARYRKRTESAARFEKMLDPNQNIIGIERFVKLLNDAGLSYHVSAITSVGPDAQALTISITHQYIEERLGITIAPEKVQALLHALDCQVTRDETAEEVTYHVTVPTMRSTKDIRIKEDLLEEIGRLYGYAHIASVLPQRDMKPSDLSSLYRNRRIKQLLSFGMQMHEVKNYAFYNASFLHELGWQPDNAVSIGSPVSEQYRQLATSLIPGLLANIQENYIECDELRFFEWGRIWHQDTVGIFEQPELAGIFYTKKEPIHFYEIKACLEQLFTMLRLPVTWHKEDRPHEPWFAPYQTARIMHNDTLVGTMGIIDVSFVHHLFTGHAAAFTLNGMFVDNFVPQPMAYHAHSKYPSIDRDVSMMVPSSRTVAEITQAIASCSPNITSVQLIDLFEKAEWEGKSLAFRITMQDAHKTLTHEQAEEISAAVIKKMQALGAQIR